MGVVLPVERPPLMPAVLVVGVDEKAWWLTEGWGTVPGAIGGPHLIQKVQVVRNDSLAVYRRDLGRKEDLPLSQQHTQGFSFWAGFEYSVGEVMEIAERLRENRPPEDEPTDLIGAWRQTKEEKRGLQAHRSVVGPYSRIERR